MLATLCLSCTCKRLTSDQSRGPRHSIFLIYIFFFFFPLLSSSFIILSFHSFSYFSLHLPAMFLSAFLSLSLSPSLFFLESRAQNGGLKKSVAHYPPTGREILGINWGYLVCYAVSYCCWDAWEDSAGPSVTNWMHQCGLFWFWNRCNRILWHLFDYGVDWVKMAAGWTPRLAPSLEPRLNHTQLQFQLPTEMIISYLFIYFFLVYR